MLNKRPTVRPRTKSHDPRNPPTMVFIWVAAKNGLYICIAENSRTEKIDDNANDTPLDAPEKYVRIRSYWSKMKNYQKEHQVWKQNSVTTHSCYYQITRSQHISYSFWES